MAVGSRPRDATWLWEVGAVLTALAYAVIYSWPVLVQPAHWVWGSHGDALGNIFDITWAGEMIRNHQPLRTDRDIAIPFGEQLGSQPHEPLYFWTIVPLSLAIGPIAAMNLVSLLAIPISSWLMYRLAHQLTASAQGAFIAGIAFGCCSFTLQNSRGEPTLVQVWIFPMVLLALLAMLRRATPLTSATAGVAVAMACLVNFYYTLFIGLLATTFVGTWLVVTYTTRRRLPAAALGAAVAAAAIGLLLPATIYYRTLSDLQGAASHQRSPADLGVLAPEPLDFLLPPYSNPWFGSYRQELDIGKQKRLGFLLDFSEMEIALPIVVLAPVGTLLLARKPSRSRVELVALVPVSLLGLWLTVPTSAVPRHRLSLQWDIYLLLPYFRAYHRAVILVELGAIVLSALALARLFVWKRWLIAPVLLGTTLLILTENFSVTDDRALEVVTPPAYTWINAHPGTYAIAEYPLLPESRGGGNEYTYQFNQRFHHHPLLNGHLPATESESMREEMRDPNREGVPSRLSAVGVRYVVWHPDIVDRMALISESFRKPLEEQRPLPIGYQLEASLPDRAEIWSVQAAPQTFAFFARGFGEVARSPNGVVRMMETTIAQLDIYGIRTERSELTLRCTSDAPRSLEVLRGHETLGSWTASPGIELPLALATDVTPGVSRLTLRASTDGLKCSLPRVIEPGTSER
jgi:hypothetical protein